MVDKIIPYKYKDGLKGKKILIVGIGRSGTAAMETLYGLGASISAQDSKLRSEWDEEAIQRIEKQCQKLYLGELPTGEELRKHEMLVLSPGVPTNLSFIVEAEEADIEVIGEMELAYRMFDGDMVAITGTNGKTTTTSLVGEIFKAGRKKAGVVGNIGIPVISETLKNYDWLITEVSSFQLETTVQFHPSISCILNLTPDHLDRHKTMENYRTAKAKIFANQGAKDFCVVNFDDVELYEFVEKHCKATVVPFSKSKKLKHGAYVEDGNIKFAESNGEISTFCGAEELKIPGEHNLENALAAVAMACCAKIQVSDIKDALISFKGVEHRLEHIGKLADIEFINDSKGTNPDSSIKALAAMKENIMLIAGGYDKNADFGEFIDAFKGRVKGVFLIGATAEKIKKQASDRGFTDAYMCKSMEDAMLSALENAERGDKILLSPACASWDMYKNFEERGQEFKKVFTKFEKDFKTYGGIKGQRKK